MPAFNLQTCGDDIVEKIRVQRWFPVDTGNLRDNALTGTMMPIASEEIYRIRFDSTIAPYVSALEEGKTITTAGIMTPGRNIGLAVPFDSEKIGTTRISQFKSGKHMGFISDKTINYIIKYICNKYDGELR